MAKRARSVLVVQFELMNMAAFFGGDLPLRPQCRHPRRGNASMMRPTCSTRRENVTSRAASRSLCGLVVVRPSTLKSTPLAGCSPRRFLSCLAAPSIVSGSPGSTSPRIACRSGPGGSCCSSPRCHKPESMQPAFAQRALEKSRSKSVSLTFAALSVDEPPHAG